MAGDLRRWIASLSFLVLALLPLPARAGDPAAAEALYQRGRDLMAAGNLAEACETFEASMAAEPAAGTLLNLAKCHEDQGKLATAWGEYERAAPMFRQRGEDRRAEFAAEAAQVLEPRLMRLTVLVTDPPDGLVVTRDGFEIPPTMFGTPVPVDPGIVRLRAEAPGYATWTEQVTLQGEGRTETVEIMLARGGPPPPPPPEGQSVDDGTGLDGLAIGGLVVGGVGAGAMIAGAVFGGMAISDADEAQDDPALCPGKVCTPEGRRVIDGAETKALASSVLLGVGGGLVAGGLLMFLLAPSEPDGDGDMLALPLRAVPELGRERIGLIVFGTF